jgi:asparagine synthetase B (glutamine-hydrolysing)
MVFNGTIDMRTKPEMEKDYGIVMNSDNDGEIMLQSKSRIELLLGNITFAGLFLEKNTVYAMRNPHRPAYWTEKHDSIYIASTADIMKRCLLRPHELQPQEMYSWTA